MSNIVICFRRVKLWSNSECLEDIWVLCFRDIFAFISYSLFINSSGTPRMAFPRQMCILVILNYSSGVNIPHHVRIPLLFSVGEIFALRPLIFS